MVAVSLGDIVKAVALAWEVYELGWNADLGAGIMKFSFTDASLDELQPTLRES
jgi:hypothetical protein